MRVDGDDDVFCCIVTVESTLNLTLVPSMLLSSSDHGVYYTYTCACAWIVDYVNVTQPQNNHGRRQ